MRLYYIWEERSAIQRGVDVMLNEDTRTIIICHAAGIDAIKLIVMSVLWCMSDLGICIEWGKNSWANEQELILFLEPKRDAPVF
jgi:hypothetical protein